MTKPPSVCCLVWVTAWLVLSGWETLAQTNGSGVEPRVSGDAASQRSGVPAFMGGTLAAARLQRTVAELDRRERYDEVELYVEQAIRRHPEDWRVLFQGARIYAELERSGYWIDGGYRRGDLDGVVPAKARRVYSHARDHRRALQLIDRAIRAASVDPPAAAETLAAFYWEAAQIFTGHKGYLGLYDKTDLNILPTLSFREPEVLHRAPVPLDGEGNPRFFEVPASWGDARNDGERLLWLLKRARSLDARYAAEAEFIHAKYLLKDYLGVQTVAESPNYNPLEKVFDGDYEERRLLDSMTGLSDGETICRVGTSLRRLVLPDEHNFIKRFQTMAADPTMRDVASEALQELAECYENRRQYEAAAACWARCVKRFGTGEPAWEQERLDQIVGNWGFIENAQTFKTGEPVILGYWFRNAGRASFQARRLDERILIDDIRGYLESDPFPLDPDRIDVAMLGKHVVMEGGEKYLGETVAEWSRDLEALPHHRDARAEIEVPINEPGAYWVEATAGDGNTCGVIVWINDLSILRRPLEDGTFYYVTNTTTGRPAREARFSFVGFRLHLVNQETEERDEHGEAIPEALRRQYHVTTRQIEKAADANGQLILDDDQLAPDHRWFLLATAGKSVAILGFSDLKAERMDAATEAEARYFVLTDREVYLPGQMIRYRGWLRRPIGAGSFPEYEVVSEESVELVVVGRDGEVLIKESVMSDAEGSIAGAFRLPEGSLAGAYHLVTICGDGRGWASFDVAPAAMKAARLQARVGQGLVVRGETVKVRVSGENDESDPLAGELRYEVRERPFSDYWYREGEHDWLFGRGYTHELSPFSWLPGWDAWGWPAPRDEGEQESGAVILSGELTLNEAGEATIALPTLPEAPAGQKRIKTGPATWEIMVRTRGRAEAGTKATVNCVVVDHRCRVYAALDRSHYELNDPARFEVWLRDYLGNPVKAAGSVIVERLTLLPNSGLRTRPVFRRPLTTDKDGYGRCSLGAHVPGLYRTSFQFRHEGKLVSGGAAATVKSEVSPPFDEDGALTRHVALLSDKAVYEPGDTVRLTVQNAPPEESFALFVRPRAGHYGHVQILSPESPRSLIELEATNDDIPSFHVEAVPLSGGDFKGRRREIVVAPPSIPLTVAVRLDRSVYGPGETADLTLDLTDAKGDRCGGQAVVSVTPANVGASRAANQLPSAGRFSRDIRRFFWDTRVPYAPAAERALKTNFQSFSRPLEAVMRPVGLFGEMKVTSAEEPALFQELTNLPGETVGPAAVPEYAERSCADPVFWLPDLVIPETGHCSLPITLPRTFGEWRVRVWVMGTQTRPGYAEATVRTEGGWRIEAALPRLAVQGDTLTLTATVRNRSPETLLLNGKVQLAGPGLRSVGDDVLEKTISVADGTRETVSWRFQTAEIRDGKTTVKMRWQEDGAPPDAWKSWEQEVRVLPRESRRVEVWNAVGQSEVGLEMKLPEIADTAEATLKLSVAGGIVPAIHAILLERARRPLPVGGGPEGVMAWLLPVFQWHQGFRVRPEEERERFAAVSGFDALTDEERIRQRMESALVRLEALQKEDGGWSWVPSSTAQSDVLSTAIVVRGLSVLVAHDVEEASPLLEEGLEFLEARARAQVLALQNARMGTPAKALPDASDALLAETLAATKGEGGALAEALWKAWRSLPQSGQVLLATALHHRDEVERRNEIRFHLGELLDKGPEGAIRLKGASEPGASESLSWHHDENLRHAVYLRFLGLVKGDNPVADGVALRLLANRKSMETFGGDVVDLFVLDALNAYLRLKPEMAIPQERSLELKVDETVHEVREWKSADVPGVLAFDLPLDRLGGDTQRIGVQDGGATPLIALGTFDVSEVIPAASAEGAFASLARDYRRSTAEADGSDSAHLSDGEKVMLGEVVDVALRLHCRRPVERVVLLDPLPGGFELQGSVTVPDAEVAEENGRLVIYFERLEEGEHVIAYRLQAAIPGDYWALPAEARASFDGSSVARSDERFLFIRP